MEIIDGFLRISAQRALLGAVHPEVRLIKVRREGDTICLTTLAARPLSNEAADALSTAAAEIVADFPGCRIEERVLVTMDPIPVEDVLSAGWIYQRAEPVRRGPDRLDVWHDGSAICVIAVGSHGDPLDLGEDEVEDLIVKLQAALAQERA